MADGDSLETIFIILFSTAIIGFAIFMVVWTYRRGEELVDQWAAENGLRIVHREHRMFRKGPFFWTTGRGQLVYYFIVEDRFGMQRAGWARCGSWFMGMLSNQIEVRWEE